ncbi:MAG: poly-gamma-glutamate biosynthesis protein PgsC [Candidatus Marinimicrobia bacterium]|nr:poly-gamma-glutamate biosynthesis protein PgsC [Candidatus Neomarinimicrobiota bacterium]|tara:strand:+ start:11058 stop:11504 length:447 start_codon:yes stop_codon:yes gene_type:complete
MVELAIGLGMILSLILTETLGVTAGGIIVPGYIALYLGDPIKVISTFLISILVYLVVKLLSNFLLIYGKRRLVLSLLLGFLLGYVSKVYFSDINNGQYDLSVIGNIIPGLIASWMDRQGVLRTISVILITSSIVKMILIIISEGRIDV